MGLELQRLKIKKTSVFYSKSTVLVPFPSVLDNTFL